jgi:uncharacterized membrane protein YeiH
MRDARCEKGPLSILHRTMTTMFSQAVNKSSRRFIVPFNNKSSLWRRKFRSHTKQPTTGSAVASGLAGKGNTIISSGIRSNNKATAAAVTKQINAPSQRGRQDDSLARFPHFRSPGGILRGLDYAGTVTFAVTGSVTAAQSGLDVFGCCMIGMVTAVGGGTIRDAIFLSRKPFWTDETEYIWMTVATALVTFFAWPSVIEWQNERHNRANIRTPSSQDDIASESRRYDEIDVSLDALDSIGLAAFAIIGAQNGVRAGMPMIVSAICGVATATFGGMTRDVLCGRPVRIVHSNVDVYAPPALAGATVYLWARRAGAVPSVTIGLALATCIGSRYLAIRNDIKLHTWDTEDDGLGVSVRK